MPSRTTTTNHRRPRLAAVLSAVLVSLLLGLVAVVPATATPPFALPGQITDQVGAVEGHTAGVQAAIDNLETRHGIRMWVVFVDTFDGTDPQAWADQTFTATSLGTADYLLAVAMTDRQYGYVVDQGFALDDAALARVATAAERHLAENPARAVTTAARTMGAQLTGASRSGTVSSEYTWGIVPAVLTGLAILVAIGIAVTVAVVLTRRDDRLAREGKVSWISSVGLNQPGAGATGSSSTRWNDNQDTWSSHDTWSSSSGGSSSGGGGGTRGGSSSF
jgi:uncharacterized membrane protein YgcG